MSGPAFAPAPNGSRPAIGGMTIAATSEAVDIDKRVFDETKKQTDELKKINEALRSGGVAVLT